MMKTSRIFTTILLLAAASAAFAVPARKGIRRQINLMSGEKVTAELCGDEFFSYFKSDDGRKYVLDASANAYTEHGFEHFSQRGDTLRRLANSRRLAHASRLKGLRPKASLGGTHAEYTGTKKGIVILVNFADKKFKFNHTRNFFNRMANEAGFTSSLGFVGSVKDYFIAQSNGQFELDFDVAGPYTLPHEYAYYGQHSSSGSNDRRPGTMIRDAVRLADNDVDFSLYDWDGDGSVDQVFVLYAGLGEAAGGDANTIWPHEWYLSSSEVRSPYTTNDGVSVNQYACSSEQTLNHIGNEQVNGIGTLCHEFSHCLGLPDLYDTSGSNFGMGAWDLLDSGSYNDKDGTQGLGMCPPNYSAYEKWYCGWIEPIELTEATTVRALPAQHDKYGQVFVVYNDSHTDECYLLENRRNDNGDTWDQSLLASGLMIQHVDYNADVWRYNIVNTTSGTAANYFSHDHQSLTIFHADNSERDYAGDLYPYNDNNSLTDTSTPAAVVYNGGPYMGKPITNITRNDNGTIDFDFMGGSSSNVVNAIRSIGITSSPAVNEYYLPDGRLAGTNLEKLPTGLYISNGKKITKK